jgi:hypothetical protein
MDAQEFQLEERKLELETRKLKYERIGLLTSFLTPVAIVVVGYFIQNAVSQADREWKSGERRAEQREKVYAELGPLLNIIYCYVDDVGDYTRFSPEEVIDKKRSADRLFFTYHSYWSASTKTAYDSFMRSCFEISQGGYATDAKIKSAADQKRAAFAKRGIEWKPSWNEAFSPAEGSGTREKYLALVIAFLGDLERNYRLGEK